MNPAAFLPEKNLAYVPTRTDQVWGSFSVVVTLHAAKSPCWGDCACSNDGPAAVPRAVPLRYHLFNHLRRGSTGMAPSLKRWSPCSVTIGPNTVPGLARGCGGLGWCWSRRPASPSFVPLGQSPPPAGLAPAPATVLPPSRERRLPVGRVAHSAVG